MSAVKVGDRIRATCGESVIVGTVSNVHSDDISVSVDGAKFVYFCSRAWTVEVLPPPIPDVVGTIIRDGDGDAWQRYDDLWWSLGASECLSVAEVQECYGPLTVLWTPGDAT